MRIMTAVVTSAVAPSEIALVTSGPANGAIKPATSHQRANVKTRKMASRISERPMRPSRKGVFAGGDCSGSGVTGNMEGMGRPDRSNLSRSRFDEIERVLPGRACLETAPAAGFVEARRADHDQIIGCHQALGEFRRSAALHTDGQGFGDLFGQGKQGGNRLKRAAQVVRIESGYNHLFAHVRQPACHLRQFWAEKVCFIDSDQFGPDLQKLQNLARRVDGLRRYAQVAMRNDLVARVAIVNGGLEYLNPLTGDHAAPHAADQLFAFARKH